MKSMLRLGAIMLLSLAFATNAQSQISGSITVGSTTYPTLDSTIRLLNASGIGSGGVTVNVPAAYTETLTRPLSLTATGTSATPIVFQKTGTGANPLVTAYTGTATPSSSSPDGIWNLVGSDYVTINGIDLRDTNSANPATMEYGYGLFKASATNGCQNNVIKNCVVTLNRINNASGSGPMVDGSAGILAINSIPTAATTALTVTAASGSNSRNQFYSNTVQNCNTGIALIGYAASTYSLADTLNDVGGTSAATGNTIVNFGGGGATNAAAGIRTLAQYAVNVSYNTINNNNGGGINHGTTLRGIFINTASSATETISNNNITVISAATSSNLEGIENVGGSGTGGSVTINGNTISNCAYNTSTSGYFYGIYNNGSSPDILAINNNTMSGFSMNPSSSSSGYIQFIYNSSTIGVTFTINGNTIQSSTGLNTTGNIYAVYNNNSTNSYSFNNNIINNIGRVATLSGTMYAYYNFGGGSGSVTLNNNRISNMTNGTGTYYGIYHGTGSSQNVNYTGNNVNNITSGGVIYGLYNTYGNTVNMSSDTLSTFTSGSTIYGLYAGASSTQNCNSYQNVLSTLYSTGGTVYGIYLNASYGSSTVNACYKNKIYDLQTSYSSGSTYGIYTASSYIHNIYNNIIGDLKATTSTSTNAVACIYISSGSTVTISYNTVRLAATSTSTSTFGTSALYIGTTSAAVTARNNIWVNVSTPGSTGGVTAALRYTSTPATSAYTTSSNNNLYYAGAASSTNLLYVEGTGTTANGQQTISSLKTYLSNRDQASVTENPSFVSTTGSSGSFLHINTATATLAESGGTSVSGITDDYDGDVRYGNTGYSGSGSAPDIGADEFNGTAPGPKITSVSISPTGNQCIATARTISATINPNGGTLTSVTLSYSFNGGAATTVALTGGSTTTTSTWTGTISAATPANAVVTWSVTATDGTYPKTYTGTSYQDAPFTGVSTPTITASATTFCAGNSTTLKVLPGSVFPSIVYDSAAITFDTTATPTSGVTTLASGGSATTSLTAGSLDDGYWTISLPFNISLYGTSYSSASIGTNGNVQFTSSPATAGYSSSWPGTTAPLATFGALFGDFNESVQGTVNYFVTGTAPNRALVVNWKNVRWFGYTDTVTVQAKLYETSNVLETYIAPFTTSNSSHKVGVINATGTAATQPSTRTLGSWTVSTPEAWRFSPQIGPGYAVLWTPNGAGSGIPTGTQTNKSITVTPTSTTTYTATISDANSCSIAATRLITVNPLPVITVAPTPAALCIGSSIGLKATGASSYVWSPSSTLSGCHRRQCNCNTSHND